MKVFASTFPVAGSIWVCILQIGTIGVSNLLSKEKQWGVSHLTGRYIQTTAEVFASHPNGTYFNASNSISER